MCGDRKRTRFGGNNRLARMFPAISLLLSLAVSACAAPDSEIHAAPFFSRHTIPGYDYAEAFGGILRYGEKDQATTWALSPLVWRREHESGEVEADFLYPLGRYEHDPDRPRTFARLFPIFWREAEVRPDGIEDIDWSVLTPFFWGGSSSDDLENYFAFWPIFGTLRDFLTYDEVSFLFWPFYLSNRKDERESTHILWPFFGWVEGSEQGWHIWPLYGRAEVPGKYKRSYFLWPLAHFSENKLDQEHPEHGWLVVPLGGEIRQDDYVATTALWPIFGWASRPSTGYRSWQVWPFLKFESGGKNEKRQLSRVLPFWLHFEDEDTEYTSYMWPLIWVREDRFGDIRKDSFYAVPFYWQTRTLRKVEGEEEVLETGERLWPFIRNYEDSLGREDFATLAPGFDPILNSKALSRNLGFLFEIWAGRADGTHGTRERRAFLNLYHSMEAAGHKRWSIPFLGGQWTEPDGTTHTSLFLGLLRFKSGPDGGLEEPAFPGPGWPDLHKLPGPDPRDPARLRPPSKTFDDPQL